MEKIKSKIMTYMTDNFKKLKPLYKVKKSTSKNKKYMVYVKGDNGKPKLLHYPQFRDKLGHYSHLDHNDKKRRDAYYKRHGPAKSKDTRKYWAHKILW